MSTVEKVLEAWRGIALDNLRPEIHRYAQAMKAAETRSQNARKNLAKMLQSLKQTQHSDPEPSVINKAVSNTIKSFQREVDELTKRSSYAESCFLQVYNKLYQAPDPLPAFSKALIEMQKTQESKLDQDTKQNSIRNSDHCFTQSFEGEVSSDDLFVQVKNFELEKDRLLEESQLRENLLQQELQKCRDLLSKTQVQLDDLQSRFVKFYNRKENEETSRVHFSNSINEELLILKSQLGALKLENVTLKKSLDQASDLTANVAIAETKRRAADTQQQLGQLLRNYNISLQENETLRQQLIKYANDKIAFEQSHQAEVKLLHSKFESLSEAFSCLPSLDEFNALKLQAKMQKARECYSEGESASSSIESSITKADTLKSDVNWMHLEHPPAQSINIQMQDIDQKQKVAPALAFFNKNTRSGSKDFLNFQRTRYRKALESLEIEKSTLQSRNESLIQQLNVLKTDNENLFLRLKAKQPNYKNRGNDLEQGNIVENKYAKIIDEKENPFSTFATNRGQSQLNAIEKMMLIGTKVCLGRRSLRAASFLYIATLHALVFFSLLTHTVIPHCPQNTKP